MHTYTYTPIEWSWIILSFIESVNSIEFTMHVWQLSQHTMAEQTLFLTHLHIWSNQIGSNRCLFVTYNQSSKQSINWSNQVKSNQSKLNKNKWKQINALNQAINQSANEPINPPTNKPIHQSINPSIHLPPCLPACLPTYLYHHVSLPWSISAHNAASFFQSPSTKTRPSRNVLALCISAASRSEVFADHACKCGSKLLTVAVQGLRFKISIP